MEQVLRNRILVRENRLTECVTEAREAVEQITEGQGVHEGLLIRTKLSLKQALQAYNDETNYLMGHAEAIPVLLNMDFQTRTEAEKILVDLEMIQLVSKENAQPQRNQGANTKLPKLDLIKFDGDILKWTAFWDRFEVNIHCKPLSDVEKLAYLMSSLVGNAQECLEGLPITNSNYAVAVKTLRDRYGQGERVVDAHYEVITKLERCCNKAEECRKTFDSIERHLRILESLGESVASSHLRGLIMSKFPESVLYELNLRLTTDKSVENIRKMLNQIISAMELSQVTLEPVPSTSTEPSSSTQMLHVKTQNERKFVKRKRVEYKNSTSTGNIFEGKGPSAKKTKRSCLFCEGDHFNDQCTAVKEISERKSKLKGRCFRCLSSGHRIDICKSIHKCCYCKGDHNRALCPKKAASKLLLRSFQSSVTSTDRNHKLTSFLQTATAQAHHNNKSFSCRVLLDSGSQRSYITSRMAKKLNLTPESEDLLMIYTFGDDKPRKTVSPFFHIDLETKRGTKHKICVNEVSYITDKLPVPNIDNISNIIDILADDGSVGEGIDILIGNDYYFSFMRQDRVELDDHLYLVDSDFGWIVSGHSDMQHQKEHNILTVLTYHQNACNDSYFTEPDLPLKNIDIKFLWSLDSIGITDPIKATCEEAAVQHFNDTVKYENGRYCVKWPWTYYPPNLPTNYGLAYGRLKGLIQRLDTVTLREYQDIINEQLSLNIIEEIGADTDPFIQRVPPLHYLPHHMVKSSGKRGRIVYDASANVKEQQSLNECMYRGPCMLQDLTGLLINFRMNKIGITADVEKAFLQVGLQPEDRDMTRFLWLRDINRPLSNDNLLHLRFCRVPFGIISSPFLLTAVIRHHIATTKHELLGKIADKFYVDNLVTGTNSTQEALRLYEESRSVFDEQSMNIRDWTSNDETFLKKIPKQHRAEPTDDVKVLGLIWNKAKDTLRLQTKADIFCKTPQKLTKRKVLQIIASIYDPCGFVSPLVLPAKLFLQELWKKNYKWDVELSPELTEQWEFIMSNLRETEKVEIPRYAALNTVTKETKYEIHCFTDASQQGYAAVAYLRADNGSNIKVSFLMSKNRIVPANKRKKAKQDTAGTSSISNPTTTESSLTIPQLELLGCLIGSRLLSFLKKMIDLKIERQYMWTDSLIVLSWINSNKLLPPFVANRVNEIKQHGDVKKYYVNTKQNPADVSTRPELWSQKKDLWFKGPSFLSKVKDMWPKNRHLEDHHEYVNFCAAGEGLEKEPPDQDMIETAIEYPTQTNEHPEIREIKIVQSKYFPDEIKGKETNLSRNLGLFKDIDGVLRCGGRMMYAELPYDAKHPILIPKDCEFTMQVVRDAHVKNYHVGIPHTLSIIRQKYWIPQGRMQVRKVVKQCPQCSRHGGGPYKLPTTPALPPERVKYSAPFSYIGIDYFGPMLVNVKNGKEKRWVCLLTCLVTRAIHLEIVKDMTAEECLMAMRRFMATRGVPIYVLSDNAQQFKLTSDVMTNSYCIQNKIKWKFTPELAPWHGGVYERLVAVVKHCLKRSLGKHLLNDSQLHTVMKEVESVVNTRPLTCVGADQEHILKPIDFLSLGECLTTSPMSDHTLPEGTATKQDLVAGWRRGQNILKEFKEMFISQYLPSLREKYRHSLKQPRVKSDRAPSIGDVVQIKGDSKNRQNWRVGRISSLIQGIDGEYRVAKVKVGDIEFTRSIGHLYPLEAEIVDNSEVIIRPLVRDTEMLEIVPENIQHNDENCEVPMVIDIDMPINEEPEASDVARESEIVDSVEGTKERVDGDSVETSAAESQMADQLKRLSLEIECDVDHGESEVPVETEGVVRRAAAVKAREKIAQWTRQLVALL